jgi:aminoglycoside phosphotransferase family enzyme/predicted kinase
LAKNVANGSCGGEFATITSLRKESEFNMVDENFNALVRRLSTAAAYPHAPGRVDVVETHISFVFLSGQFAYKLKKPVKYDFLDFTSLEKREQACREEVRLNRRLAADIYLGVIPITQEPNGTLQLNGTGVIVDWLVHMRRLPIEETLDKVLRRGELHPEHIDQLASVLATFYRGLEPLPVAPREYRDRYAAHVCGNLNELLAVSHHCPADIVRRVHGFQLQLLHLQPELFEQRVHDGRIVEGHGDLRPEHICFSKPIAIFDCIEFSLDFRRIDIADELAFLAAECDFLGAEWIGPQLFKAMESLIGHRPPPVLIDFYKSYRSCVRAKVNALRADQLTGQDRDRASNESSRHLDLADSYVRHWARPLLVVVGGLSGTGKSTLATHLATLFGCELLQTDVIRIQLFGKSERPVAFESGNYSRSRRRRVYVELIGRAMALLQNGVSVVLDGTFSMAAILSEAHQTVAHRATFLAIECICDQSIARQRIASRVAEGSSFSEMRPELRDQQSVHWEPWPTEIPQIRIDTQQSVDRQIVRVLKELRNIVARLTR